MEKVVMREEEEECVDLHSRQHLQGLCVSVCVCGLISWSRVRSAGGVEIRDYFFFVFSPRVRCWSRWMNGAIEPELVSTCPSGLSFRFFFSFLLSLLAYRGFLLSFVIE